MQDRHSKTEQATAKRRQDARRKGNVPRTQELSAAFVMAGALLFFRWFGTDWLRELERLMAWAMTHCGRAANDPLVLVELTRAAANSAGLLLLLPVGLLACASLSGNLLQGPPPFTLQPLTPDITKVNPLKGLKKVFRLKALVDLAKALFKGVLFSVIVWNAVSEALREGLPGSGPAETLIAVATLASRVMVRVVVLMLALALIDLLYTRWDWARGLRMTKHEVKEEHKQLLGDPLTRMRIRRKQEEMSRNRMMAEIPRATVVVTNPTHYAVALRYVAGDTDVPLVVAKGADLLAARIRETALRHGVPIRRDPTLARALYRAVRVGDAIPAALFHAVAEILALVMRGGQGQRDRGGRPQPDPEVRG